MLVFLVDWNLVTNFIILLERPGGKLVIPKGRGLKSIWRVKPSYPSLLDLPVSHLQVGSSHMITCKIEGLSSTAPIVELWNRK